MPASTIALKKPTYASMSSRRLKSKPLSNVAARDLAHKIDDNYHYNVAVDGDRLREIISQSEDEIERCSFLTLEEAKARSREHAARIRMLLGR